MAKTILDPTLLAKLAKKLDKSETYIRQQNSRKARKQGISPEAALVITAEQEGIGTAYYRRKLDSTKRAEIRDALLSGLVEPKVARRKPAAKVSRSGGQLKAQKRAGLRPAIDFLIEDQTLRDRCTDLLLARRNFDRVINQATQVLEDRIRTKSGQPRKVGGEKLVNVAVNTNPLKTILPSQ